MALNGVRRQQLPFSQDRIQEIKEIVRRLEEWEKMKNQRHLGRTAQAEKQQSVSMILVQVAQMCVGVILVSQALSLIKFRFVSYCA